MEEKANILPNEILSTVNIYDPTQIIQSSQIIGGKKLTTRSTSYCIVTGLGDCDKDQTLRPGAHQSSKTAFGKSAFARSNLLLDRACLLLPKAKAF